MSDYDITIKRGDTWLGANCEFLLNNVAVDLTDATILSQVKRAASDETPVQILATTISDATAGKFTIDACIFDLSPRAYVYDVQITLASGRVVTPIDGTLTITSDVSR